MSLECLRNPMSDDDTRTDRVRTYRCDACEREFESAEALEEHVRSVGLVN